MAVAAMRLPEVSSIHDQYLSLSRVARDRFAGTLGGKLLLRVGLDAAGIAQLVAASVAGAASLCVDADGAALREGLRAGLCDFVVGDLDEALRILKNEVRRRLPVAVCLMADRADSLAAMVERGVQPDLLFSDGIDGQKAGRTFVERGAFVLSGDENHEAGTSLLCWSVATEAARVMPQISRIASAALDDERADTVARRRWLEVAPRYLGRAFGSRQCLRVVETEATSFLAAVRPAFPSAEITVDGAAV
jgi:hypothetical protein